MSAGDDLIAFIRARLDEDEAVAREAASALPGDEGYGWRAVHRYLETHPASGESFIVDTSSELVAQPASARSYDRAVADHIARHDPARALRQVAGARRILDEHSRESDGGGGAGCGRCDWDHYVLCNEPNACETVRSLGMTWSDHPDYRQEWAP